MNKMNFKPIRGMEMTIHVSLRNHKLENHACALKSYNWSQEMHFYRGMNVLLADIIVV